MDEKRKQVADQCRVVAHLAKAIWEVYSDKARMFASDMTGANDIVDLVGNNSARHMNKLGDILNGMDAVEDDDAWTDPIFERAKQQFPQETAHSSTERAPIDGKDGKLKISVLCSDVCHPIYPHLVRWVKKAGVNHTVELIHQKAKLSGGDILFLISCHEIISPSDRAKYRAALVIHASDLPEGRGWSPHIWQILAGENDIIVSLIEAQDPVDTGPIWAQRVLSFEGHELADGINEKLFDIELNLMDLAIEFSLCGPVNPVPQDDRAATYYPRRAPEDSRLDPSRSIAEQFDLLRVADPKRFPAFFDFRGHRYVVRIEKG